MSEAIATGKIIPTDFDIFVDRHPFPGGSSADGRFPHHWSIGLTLAGRCHWRWPEDETWVAEGVALVVRPNTSMIWQVPRDEPEWHTIYVIFRPTVRCENWLSSLNYSGGIARLALDGDISARVRHGMVALHRVFSRGAEYREEWALLALERVLLTLHVHMSTTKLALDPRVNQAVRFIHEHYAEPVSVGDVARAAHLSISQLSLLFSGQLQESPMQYLERLRCERAAEMLRLTSNPIREIAAGAGYRDAAYFCNRFRRFSGLSPSGYRRSFGK